MGEIKRSRESKLQSKGAPWEAIRKRPARKETSTKILNCESQAADFPAQFEAQGLNCLPPSHPLWYSETQNRRLY